MLNSDGTVNTTTARARAGTVVAFFATGVGPLLPRGIDGELAAGPGQTEAPIAVRINSREAEVLYAGPAPGLVNGAAQINVRIPDDLVGPGAIAELQVWGERSATALFWIAPREP